MKQSLKVLFQHKSSKATQSSIVARIMLDWASATFTTGVKCTLEEWSVEKRRINPRSKGASERNAILSNIENRLFEIFYTKRASGENLSAKIIKELFLGNSLSLDKRYLIAAFANHNAIVQRQVGVSKSKATYQKYQVTLRHLQDYVRCITDSEDILFSKLSYQFVCGFELHLRTACGCAHNTAAKFMQFFKRIILIAINDGYLKENPFRNYNIKLKRVNRVYLTMEELQKMMEKEFSVKRLEQVRDLFIFASFTGISYIDIKNLRREHLCSTSDGSWWLRFDRKKSGEFSNIRLLEIPKRIIEKYADESRELLFNVPSNQKVNQYLKEIVDLCGIDKPIHYHAARHTMATTVGLSNGLPIESLAKMLGHANIRTTQHYARVTDLKLGEDMDELSERLGKLFDDEKSKK
ncbi:MAG: site-specific integrase [Rikenellaceae bacterium]